MVVEDELAAELQVQLVAEALDPLEDFRCLLPEVLLVVEADAWGCHYGQYSGAGPGWGSERRRGKASTFASCSPNG